MRMRSRARIERPDGREFRVTAHTVRNKDVGYLMAAMWSPEREDWDVLDLTREEVQFLRNYLTTWLGEDN